MIEAAVGAFGGGAGLTAIISVVIKLIDRGREAREREELLKRRRNKDDIEALNATAHRTNNFWGNLSRFILLLVPQFILLALLYVGYTKPDIVIWVGQTNEATNISLLFGLIDFNIPKEVTWRAFNGIVVLPVLFAQMGAVLSYYLVGGMFSRR